MKTFFTLLITLAAFLSHAQDTTLPAALADIHLRTGKVIEEVRLWKIYAHHTEYVFEGSLHDISNSEIDHFIIGRNHYGLSDSATLFKFKNDQIFLVNGDTILCKIKLIKSHGISYVVIGESKTSFVDNWLIRKYILDGVGETIMNNTNIITEKTTAKKNRDRIILFDGDTLYCTIKKIKSTGISYIPMGTESYSFVENNFIKKYLVGVCDSSAGSVPSDSTALAEFEKQRTKHLEYYKRGERDGNKEYTGVGSFVGGMILGFIPVIGWVTIPMTMAVPPRKSPHNKKLYAQNIEYHKGYDNGAHQKKTKATLLGTFTGVGIFLMCIFL